jgi:hypothetical protein
MEVMAAKTHTGWIRVVELGQPSIHRMVSPATTTTIVGTLSVSMA